MRAPGQSRARPLAMRPRRLTSRRLSSAASGSRAPAHNRLRAATDLMTDPSGVEMRGSDGVRVRRHPTVHGVGHLHPAEVCTVRCVHGLDEERRLGQQTQPSARIGRRGAAGCYRFSRRRRGCSIRLSHTSHGSQAVAFGANGASAPALRSIATLPSSGACLRPSHVSCGFPWFILQFPSSSTDLSTPARPDRLASGTPAPGKKIRCLSLFVVR
jgi:hypothetical protein